MNTTQYPTYSLTPSDKLFYQLMGFYPVKAGTAYELISDAVTMIVTPHEKAKHDIILKGRTKAPHQIDGLVDDIAIEAKDHSAGETSTKVSIGEVMKHEAAVCDLEETTKGFFFSSTGFTSTAKQYAEGLCEALFQKGISLVHSRPSTPADEKGRIKCITVNIEINMPDYQYQVLLSDKIMKKLQKANKDVKCLNILYDKQRRERCSFDDAVDAKYTDKNIDIHNQKIETPNLYIKTQENVFIPIEGFIVNKTILKETISFDITADGKPVLWVKSDSLKINKLFTDVELKREIEKLIKNS